MSQTPASPDVAFKIIAADEWPRFADTAIYAGSDVDLADGYIHLSTPDQFAETAGKHYAGRDDLLCLTVDLVELGDTVIWEPSRGGQMFPHIYGPLPLAAVTGRRRFRVDAAGVVHDEAVS